MSAIDDVAAEIQRLAMAAGAYVQRLTTEQAFIDQRGPMLFNEWVQEGRTTTGTVPGWQRLAREQAAKDGDPRFLDQAGRALERAAALNGVTTHGQSRSTAGGDPQGVRRRVASQLDRLAAATAPPPVADEPE
jgi:hypothetical protein